MVGTLQAGLVTAHAIKAEGDFSVFDKLGVRPALSQWWGERCRARGEVLSAGSRM